MAVRNFLVEADIDGYKTIIKGGPRNKNGCMDVTLYQRDEGAIKIAVRIFCREYDGQLKTKVDVGGECVGEFVTER